MIMDPIFFDSPGAFYDWLAAHHDTAGELWVGYYKKATGRPSLTWPESVDQALCFGWIDGIRKRIDDERYTIRFTPRRPGSNWSEINIRRAGELIELGLMQPAGLAAFAARDEEKSRQYAYEARRQPLADEYEAQLRDNKAAWDFWEAQPPSYRQAATHWVMSAKREETRQKRLATLIADSEAGRRLAMLARENR
jgi:uncharacterized protein YdeI (YjbR/CyaY-like superfamily)